MSTSPFASAPADVDLSASQFCGVDLNATGELVLPSAGAAIVGILQNDPAVAGRAGTYQFFGITKMKLGGTVAIGDFVKVDTAGRAVTASGAEVAAGAAIGKCTLGGGINNIGAVQIMNLGVGIPSAGGALEIVALTGALSVTKRTTLLAGTGTVAYTLAAGLYAGQRKLIQCSVAGGIPAFTVTAAFLDTDGTTARTTALFNAVADELESEWTGAAWQVLTKTSVTMG